MTLAAALLAGLAYEPASAAEPARVVVPSSPASQPGAGAERLSGQLQLVDYRRDRRVQKHRRAHRYHRGSNYSLRHIHRRGRWCGKWVGRRCYYTPRPLRPLRQR
ncbi:hypothetical protein ACIKT0_06720 [Hansschlegelia beijingensis]|uniref:hypothetical protein n=1 Tax=Hansschlegelia beijingensis TaxID=1133344 RepID=UPI00387EF11C